MKTSTRVLLTFALGLMLILGTQVAFKMGFTASVALANSVLSSTSVSTPSLRIDTSGTPTSSTSGVIDIDVVTAGPGVIAQDINIAPQGNYSAYGSSITVASGADLSNVAQAGSVINIQGRATGGASTGVYIGNMVKSTGSTNNSTYYLGNVVAFTSEWGTLDINNTGNAEAYKAVLKKTAGSGTIIGFSSDLTTTVAADVVGMYSQVTNSGIAASSITGASIAVNLNGVSPASSTGLRVQAAQGGTLTNGIDIGSSNGSPITYGLNLSSDEIVNAMHIGTNPILASSSFSINMANPGGPATLSIINSTAGDGIVGELSVEGGVTIGNDGSATPGTKIVKHIATSVSVTSANIPAGTCATYGTITLNGAAAGDISNASPTSVGGGIETTNLSWSTYATTNGVVIRACNPTGVGIDTNDGQTWRAQVWKY